MRWHPMRMATRVWLRRSELAARYPIPIGTWARWASNREGPSYVRVGRHTLYDQEEVERWLAEHRVELEPAADG